MHFLAMQRLSVNVKACWRRYSPERKRGLVCTHFQRPAPHQPGINKELHHHFPVLAFDASSGTRYAEAGSLHHDTFYHPSSCDAGKYSPWTEWRACMRLFFTSTVSTHACEFIIMFLRMLKCIHMCTEYLHLVIINNMEKYPQTSAYYDISRSI